MTSWTLAGFSFILALKHHDVFFLGYFTQFLFTSSSCVFQIISEGTFLLRMSFASVVLRLSTCWMIKKFLMAVIPTEPVCLFIYIAFPCVSDNSSIQTNSSSSSNMFETSLCSNSELKVHLRVTTVASFPSVCLHTYICHSLTPHWSQLHSWLQ